LTHAHVNDITLILSLTYENKYCHTKHMLLILWIIIILHAQFYMLWSWTQLFHAHVSLLHRHTQVYDMTVSCIANIDMTFMLHGFTCMHALFMYSCYMDRCSCCMNYCYLNSLVLLLHEYYLNTITWLFPITLTLRWYSCYLDIPVIDLKCVELSSTWNKVSRHTCGGGYLLNPWGPSLKSHFLWILCLLLFC